MWSHPTLGDNEQIPQNATTQFSGSSSLIHFDTVILKICSLHSYVKKNQPPLLPRPIPTIARDHTLNKREATLLEDASTQLSTFLTKGFFKRVFFTIFHSFLIVTLVRVCGLYFDKIEFPLTKRCIVPSLV